MSLSSCGCKVADYLSLLDMSAKKKKPSLVVVSVVRNERPNLSCVADSVTSQTFRPLVWLIIDDGSSDGTWELLSELSRRITFLKVLHICRRGGYDPFGLGKALRYGLDYLENCGVHYDFLSILDGDTVLPPYYYSKALELFEEDPSLAVLSGEVYDIVGSKLIKTQKGRLKRARGCCLVVRSKGFFRLIPRKNLPDGSLEDFINAKAKMRNYRARSVEMPVLHIGSQSASSLSSNLLKNKGKALAYYGFPLIYVTLLSMETRLHGGDGRALFEGYLDFRRRKRHVKDNEVRRFYSFKGLFLENRFWDLTP